MYIKCTSRENVDGNCVTNVELPRSGRGNTTRVSLDANLASESCSRGRVFLTPASRGHSITWQQRGQDGGAMALMASQKPMPHLCFEKPKERVTK